MAKIFLISQILLLFATTRIDQSITLTSAAVVSQNRQYIASILLAIEYSNRQGIVLRGQQNMRNSENIGHIVLGTVR